MNILGFDTCFECCSVGVGVLSADGRFSAVTRVERMATGQAERLLPMIEAAMAEAGLRFADLDRICVTTGPGTFTGMRIGVAAARALALALKKPIITFSSLEVMAMSPALSAQPATRQLAIAADARRGQVYFQPFRPGEPPVCDEPSIVSIETAAGLARLRPATFAGTGAGLVAEAARALGYDADAILPDLQPSIADALQLAATRPPIDARPRPLYLRPPDAKPQDMKPLQRTS